MRVIGAAAVEREEMFAAVFYKRGGTAVSLKRPAVAVTTSGCLAACVSATNKKSLQVLPACDLLSCGARARGRPGHCSLKGGGPPLCSYHTPLIQDLSPTNSHGRR